MGLDVLQKQLKSGEFANIYLFYGEEEFLKEYYFSQLKSRMIEDSFKDFNFSVFSGKHIDLQQVWDAIESLPVMAQRKMIVIKDSGIFKSPKAEEKEFWEKSLPDIPDYACVVIYEADVDKRSKVYKLINKHGVVVEFAYQKTVDLVNWVERVVNSYHKKIDKHTIYYLLEHCNQGMVSVKNEIEKLVHYCEDKTNIEKEDIDSICTKSTESRVFHMIDALMTNESQKAMELLEDMKVLKEPVIKILTLIARQFSGILKTKLLLNEGLSTGEITSRLGISPFITKKYMTHARNFSVSYLHDVLEECLKVDTDIKSSKVHDWTALQLFVAQCGKRK